MHKDGVANVQYKDGAPHAQMPHPYLRNHTVAALFSSAFSFWREKFTSPRALRQTGGNVPPPPPPILLQGWQPGDNFFIYSPHSSETDKNKILYPLTKNTGIALP